MLFVASNLQVVGGRRKLQKVKLLIGGGAILLGSEYMRCVVYAAIAANDRLQQVFVFSGSS